jgi:hypothetical protein
MKTTEFVEMQNCKAALLLQAASMKCVGLMIAAAPRMSRKMSLPDCAVVFPRIFRRFEIRVSWRRYWQKRSKI